VLASLLVRHSPTLHDPTMWTRPQLAGWQSERQPAPPIWTSIFDPPRGTGLKAGLVPSCVLVGRWHLVLSLLAVPRPVLLPNKFESHRRADFFWAASAVASGNNPMEARMAEARLSEAERTELEARRSGCG
jgi:hypothetical protein